MAEVYQHDENILCAFHYGIFYYGFKHGSECQIKSEPVWLKGNVINPGDKVIGFDSGKDRTSFLLDAGYMVYRGYYSDCLLFEVDTDKPKQNDLFNEKPKWHIAFGLIKCTEILLMMSQNGCGYDINPIKIIKLCKNSSKK